VKERIYELQVEAFGINIRSSGVPPIGLGTAMVKSYPAKQPWIAKQKGSSGLLQDKMIMFSRTKTCGLAPQFTAHAEMDSNPAPAAKFEQKLFPSSKGPK